MHFRTRMLGAASLAALLILTLLPAVSAANGPVPVATGLDNPRGITIGADGTVSQAS